ncbi:MAG: hypothetical protein ACK559_05890, partial [bacterium]
PRGPPSPAPGGLGQRRPARPGRGRACRGPAVRGVGSTQVGQGSGVQAPCHGPQRTTHGPRGGRGAKGTVAASAARTPACMVRPRCA